MEQGCASKGSYVERELAIVFSVTFFSNNSGSNGQKASPLRQKVSRYITAMERFIKITLL